MYSDSSNKQIYLLEIISISSTTLISSFEKNYNYISIKAMFTKRESKLDSFLNGKNHVHTMTIV